MFEYRAVIDFRRWRVKPKPTYATRVPRIVQVWIGVGIDRASPRQLTRAVFLERLAPTRNEEFVWSAA